MLNWESITSKTLHLTVTQQDYAVALSTLLSGQLILVGGNGGSFSDAEHFVAELTGRFNGNTHAVPAMCMGSNGAELTAFGNDYGYDNIFIPYVKAFRNLMPSFLLLSTSGKSTNIVNAINTILDIYSDPNIVLLTGGNDTLFEKESKVNIIHVPSFNVQEIQEIHMLILHKLAYNIKNILSNPDYGPY